MKTPDAPAPRRTASRLCAAVLCCAWPAALPCLAAGRDDWQKPDRVVQDLRLQAGVTVADVGCGTGYFTSRLAQAVTQTGKVYAVDIDEGALSTLRKDVAQKGLTNTEVVRSEPTDTKLAAGSVDVALLCMVLHHAAADARQPLLLSIARSLKPGGLLFVIDLRKARDPQILALDRYEDLIPREDTLQMVTGAGLTLDAEFLYLPYQYFLRFRKPENWQAGTPEVRPAIPPLPKRD